MRKPKATEPNSPVAFLRLETYLDENETTEETEEKVDHAAEFAATTEKITKQLEGVTRQLATAAQAVTNRPAADPAPKPARYTEEQLWAAETEGKITAQQVTSMLRKYDREDMAAETERIVKERIQESSTAKTIDAKLGEFYAAHPGLTEDGSEDWKNAEAVYNELLAEGLPRGKATELQAYRQVFGRPSKQTEARETTTERTRKAETVAAGGKGAGKQKANPADPFDGLDERERKLYGDLMKGGVFRGKDDPNLKAAVALHRKQKADREGARA